MVPGVMQEHSQPEALSLYDRLLARGWRMTAQRRAVSRALDGEHLHLTADEVFARAQALLPEVSLATIYNTLNDLVAMGELREIAAARGPARYDPNMAPHHHLMCVDCGAIRDVDLAPADLDLRPEPGHGFELLAVDVTLRGRCPACADDA